MLEAGELSPLVDLLGAAGFLLSVAAGAARRRVTGAALSALGAEYVLVETTGRVAAATVIAYAVGLILCAELLLWAGDLPTRALADGAIVADRLVTLGAVAACAALLALVALAGSGVRIPGAFAAASLGALAAAGLLGLPLMLLRRRRRP
jgi:hypothetical protein